MAGQEPDETTSRAAIPSGDPLDPDGERFQVDDSIAPDFQATHPIRTAVETFIERTRGLREVIPLISKTASDAEDEARRRKMDALQDAGNHDVDDGRVIDTPARPRLKAGMRTRLLAPKVAATGMLHAERGLRSAMLLMMCAYFDRFIGDMMTAAFEIKPELRRALRREISFADLADLPSINSVHQLVVEKEIEATLRSSRAQQLSWFVSRCGMEPVDEILAAELTDVSEMRNLIAHHGGYVTNRVGFGSAQQQVGMLRHYRAGEPINVTREHIKHTHDVLFTAAVAISQFVWRNLREEQIDAADQSFHDITYTCLALEEFTLANRVLLLSKAFRETSAPARRLVNTVNLAQSYKWIGDQAGCRSVLETEEWELHDTAFRLAVAVLRDEWDVAESFMHECTREGLIDRSEFEDWPVFRAFRDTEHYHRAMETGYPT